MESSRPEYWIGWPFPSPGDVSNPGMEPRSPALQEDSLPAEPPEKFKIHEVHFIKLKVVDKLKSQLNFIMGMIRFYFFYI